MKARIFKPTRTAMQSGKARTHKWVIEYEHEKAKEIEPIMGWTSTNETSNEVKIHFTTKEAAIKFAKDNNIDYEIIEPEIKKITIQSYADNFK
jgi:hypothetical protein